MPTDNMDALHAWQWRDDAVWGFGSMAAGAMLGGIAPFFGGSSALFGLNPFSLAALVLIALGAGYSERFITTPVWSLGVEIMQTPRTNQGICCIDKA